MRFLTFSLYFLLAPFLFGSQVAILQFTTHSSLDAVNRGIQDELRAHKIDKKSILYNNAQGDFSTCSIMAKKLLSAQPKVFIAIATPPAQAALNAMKGKPVPLVFATVTDPIGSELVQTLEKPGGYVTGVRNIPPIVRQMEAIKEIMPEVKRLGVVLNQAEGNSRHALELLEATAREFGIEVASLGSSNSSEVQATTLSLIPRVDGFFLIQDNTVASALPTLLKTAAKFNKPVFSSYVEAVEQGALFGLAFDEYLIGKQAAQMAIKILEGAKPRDLPVEDPEILIRAFNTKTAKALHLQVPQEKLSSMDLIFPKAK